MNGEFHGVDRYLTRFLGESGAFIWGSVRDFTNTPVLSPNNASMSKLLPEAPEKLAKKRTKLVTYPKTQSR